MFCDVLFEKFKGFDLSMGVECIIDGKQVLLKKDGNVFKYYLSNKSGTKYLKSAQSAKLKHVDELVEEKNRTIFYENDDMEEIYHFVRDSFY